MGLLKTVKWRSDGIHIEGFEHLKTKDLEF
jgi:hypothetical protein